MSIKEAIGLAAIAITFIAYAPYIKTTLDGTTKPHLFSWLIWAITTLIVFLAQLADEGGAGAWPTAISGLLTLYIAYLAYIKKTDNTISPYDWIFLWLAISSIPLWYITSDPLWAVVILTTIDALGFGPTIRKAYHYPYEENLTFYTLFAIRSIISIFALENYSITTLLFPVVIALLSIIFVIMVNIRRKMISREE